MLQNIVPLNPTAFSQRLELRYLGFEPETQPFPSEAQVSTIPPLGRAGGSTCMNLNAALGLIYDGHGAVSSNSTATPRTLLIVHMSDHAADQISRTACRSLY